MLKYGRPPNHRAQSFPCRSIDDVVGSEVQRVHAKNHRPHERVSCSNRNVTSKDMLSLPRLVCKEGDISNRSFAKVSLLLTSSLATEDIPRSRIHIAICINIQQSRYGTDVTVLAKPITAAILIRNRTKMIKRFYRSIDEDVVKQDVISFTTISTGGSWHTPL